MNTYSYSTNEENYYGKFASAEEAAETGFKENTDYDSLWVGVNKKFTAHDFISVRAILEQIAENAGDECGEAVGDWLEKLEKNPAKCEELKKLFGDWLEAHEPVTFWSVNQVERVERVEQ